MYTCFIYYTSYINIIECHTRIYLSIPAHDQLSELLEGQKQHKKRIARLLGRDQELTRVSGLDSEISRVNTKIRALIAMTSLAARAKHRDQRPSTSSWDKLLPVSPGSVGDSQEVASRRLFGRVLAGDMARTTSVEPEQEEH